MKTGDHNIQNPELNLATSKRCMPICGSCSNGNVTARGFLSIRLKNQFLMVQKQNLTQILCSSTHVGLHSTQTLIAQKKATFRYGAVTTLIRNKPTRQYPAVHSNRSGNFRLVPHTNDAHPSSCPHMWQSSSRQ